MQFGMIQPSAHFSSCRGHLAFGAGSACSPWDWTPGYRHTPGPPGRGCRWSTRVDCPLPLPADRKRALQHSLQARQKSGVSPWEAVGGGLSLQDLLGGNALWGFPPRKGWGPSQRRLSSLEGSRKKPGFCQLENRESRWLWTNAEPGRWGVSWNSAIWEERGWNSIESARTISEAVRVSDYRPQDVKLGDTVNSLPCSHSCVQLCSGTCELLEREGYDWFTFYFLIPKVKHRA